MKTINIMNEELDYMSDEFIKNCIDSANDVRPGLLKTHTQKREHDLLKKKTSENKKPISVLQTEVLEESLQKPINSTNKGFSMLEKMGFKTGMGLGKDSSGIKEPIRINVKKDKMGLGHKKMKMMRKNENKISEDEFRAFISSKNKQREIRCDLKKSQRICKELDLNYGKESSDESWFWPEESEDEDEGKEDMELSDCEKLEILTKYLRERYFYCVWCKVKYEDEKDLKICPGPTRDDH